MPPAFLKACTYDLKFTPVEIPHLEIWLEMRRSEEEWDWEYKMQEAAVREIVREKVESIPYMQVEAQSHEMEMKLKQYRRQLALFAQHARWKEQKTRTAMVEKVNKNMRKGENHAASGI